MLTEIEWWGGLLIIWGALACRSMARPYEGNTLGFRVLALATYGLMGVAFALYFYELQQPLLRQAFLATAAAAGGCLLVFVPCFYRDSAEELEDEEGGIWISLLGSLLILTPLLVSVVLVGFKSWTVVQLL